jgi:hypothetical protein
VTCEEDSQELPRVDTNNFIVEFANDTRPHGNFVLEAFGRGSEHRHMVELDCAYANGDIFGNLARVYHTAHGWQGEPAFVPDVSTFERNLNNSHTGTGMSEFLHELDVGLTPQQRFAAAPPRLTAGSAARGQSRPRTPCASPQPGPPPAP